MTTNALVTLAAELERAATVGAHEAGSGAVHAGILRAETGLRVPGRAGGLAVSTSGALSARIGATQRRGVYQESAPATAAGVDPAAIADTMADVAAALGAKALS